ncbi:SoxR reducing system RseC family protein [Ligilactobacillus cholophilus]|uniref:SoxR reducing system RseC family protein n=1 Tax=Ligilactobacillus cholophilus TaxID=3050131 RepID=UPI0025B02A8D|nr:SoxR reducing system RseC family protein [Ligilactobacillus cholophilus]
MNNKKKEIIFALIYLLPLFFMILGLATFTLAAFLFNNLLGVVILGVSFVVLAIMLIPLNNNKDND